MKSSCIHRHLKTILALAIASLPPPSPPPSAAQDIKLNLTYVCNGEHIYVENCNIRDTSDTSTCMVCAILTARSTTASMVCTYETRGALKKLFPTCTQPTAQ